MRHCASIRRRRGFSALVRASVAVVTAAWMALGCTTYRPEPIDGVATEALLAPPNAAALERAALILINLTLQGD